MLVAGLGRKNGRALLLLAFRLSFLEDAKDFGDRGGWCCCIMSNILPRLLGGGGGDRGRVTDDLASTVDAVLVGDPIFLAIIPPAV